VNCIRDESLLPNPKTVTSTLLQVAIMNDERNAVYCITWRGACFPVYRAVYRALDKTVNLHARREDVADTLNLLREYSLSENLMLHP